MLSRSTNTGCQITTGPGVHHPPLGGGGGGGDRQVVELVCQPGAGILSHRSPRYDNRMGVRLNTHGHG